MYGARAQRRQPLTVILIVSSLLVLATAGLSLAPNVAAMFVGYAVVGGAIAPILIPAAVLLQRTTDPRVYTQANTWMNSASAAGIAVAAPLTGLAVQVRRLAAWLPHRGRPHRDAAGDHAGGPAAIVPRDRARNRRR